MEKVNQLELYDAGITIYCSGCDDLFNRFETVCRYSIPGEFFSTIADYFNFDYSDYLMERVYDRKEKIDKQVKVSLSAKEFIIDKRLERYNVSNLKEVYAEVVSSQLLNIELVYDNPDGSIFKYKMTYSGNFAVGWA